ncbi:MAG: flagellar hook-associated protein FlgK [Schwartzia succinivorans]|nr:flagellar hook-associated protein FlgK [Schwartzia succinivorans]
MAVRSTFAGLNTMYRGVSTNRLALDTTGHNMTNSSVTGYSRQSVNQAATSPDSLYASGTQQFVGSGVDSLSITRARDVYADKQYWREFSDQEYAKTRQTNYQKLEAIFNDADDTGLQNAILSFYQSWVDMSKEASNTSERVAVLEQSGILIDRVVASGKQLQNQIISEYEDIKINVEKVNTLSDQIVQLNKTIMAAESAGGSANDLRDERDNLVDQLSGFMSISVSENPENSMYTIVSNGASIVNGITKLNLTVGPVYDDGRQPGIPNEDYGLTDYNIEIGDTGVIFDPLTGILKAEVDAIREDKDYIDKLADMAAFLLTDFNAQHKAGSGIDASDLEVQNGTKFPTTGINFFGEDGGDYVYDATAKTWTKTGGVAYIWDEASKSVKLYDQTVVIHQPTNPATDQWKIDVATDATEKSEALKGIRIINALKVNTALNDTDGERKIAARTDCTSMTGKQLRNDVYMKTGTMGTPATITVDKPMNGTADGSNAVLLSTLLNQGDDTRVNGAASIGAASLQEYYNKAMTDLGVNSSQTNNKVISQEDIVEQVRQWRTSVSGVNWDEELTNMIMFQQGYSACSRCLTTMDEMLDRLINSTGVVGR